MVKNKTNLAELRNRLDKAVDRGDMAEIDKLLDEISAAENDYIEPVESAEFAEHIRNIKRKDDINMKRKIKFTKTIAIAAAIAVTTVVSVSGAMLLHQYSFSSGDKFYTISSDQEIDQAVIDDIISGVEAENNDKHGAKVIEANKEGSFESIEEAEKYLDMKVILPQVMPDLEVTYVKAEEVEFGENNVKKEIWATYGNVEEKAFGITVSEKDYMDVASDMTISDIDEGSAGEYVSLKGYKFYTFNESDEAGERTANIFVVSNGNCQYSLSFFNFDDEEMHAVVDSLDFE